MKENSFFTISEVAKKLNLSQKSIRRYIAANELDSVKIGSSYRIPVSALEDFINNDRKNEAKKYDLFPSVVLAQSALESSWGTSGLSSDYNNYFGIKSNSSSNSKDLMTSEFVKGKEIKINQPFREYTSIN